METVVRVFLIYIFLMFGLRMMGKREFGELAPFDLIVLLLIPELLSQSLLREDFSLTNSIIAVTTLLTLVFLTSMLSHRVRLVGRVISGAPTVVVRHGYLVTENLNRERLRPDEILDAMHQAGLHRMDQVQWAILETDGQISIIPWKEGAQQAPRDVRPI